MEVAQGVHFMQAGPSSSGACTGGRSRVLHEVHAADRPPVLCVQPCAPHAGPGPACEVDPVILGLDHIAAMGQIQPAGCLFDPSGLEAQLLYDPVALCELAKPRSLASWHPMGDQV